MASSILETETFTRPVGSRARIWPRRIAIVNDYVRIPYANGSSFASQLLYREFRKRGHEVLVIGPEDPLARPEELPEHRLLFPSLPLRNHPGVRLALPSKRVLDELLQNPPDVVLAQTGSGLLELGTWLRRRAGVPLLCVNTIHLPSVYNVLLPDNLAANGLVNSVFSRRVIPSLERISARNYTESDGLVVLSEGLEGYWRERGVTCPIFVIPRCIEPKFFDGVATHDPFPRAAIRGRRLLVICRHSREKNLERLLEIFARHVVPAVPDATLTLVGDGPDYDAFRACAEALGISDKTFFPGEQSLVDVAAWYQHADVFVYASLSETYGQVVSEALWSGLPTVAFSDGMGVSQQIESGKNGILVPPGPDQAASNWRFASEVAALLRDGTRRKAIGRAASRMARERSDMDQAIDCYYAAFDAAARNLAEQRLELSGDDSGLTRWTALHVAAAALGVIRKPAVVNRNGRRHPVWDTIS